MKAIFHIHPAPAASKSVCSGGRESDATRQTTHSSGLWPVASLMLFAALTSVAAYGREAPCALLSESGQGMTTTPGSNSVAGEAIREE